MNSLKYGDIVQIRLSAARKSEQTDGLRYGVVISSDAINDNLNTVIVCPLIEANEVSKSRIGVTFIPREVLGSDRNRLAFSLQIKTVSKSRIVKRINSLPANYMRQIKESLTAVLDLS